MPHFKSLKPKDKVVHAMRRFNTGLERPLLKLQQVIMRAEDSPLTIGERELLAAYTSRVNSCEYCGGAHEAASIEYGMDNGLVLELLSDIDSANIKESLKPIFRFARKLTLEPSEMNQADADAVFDAGWSERALYDAIAVCCVFNYMNRYVLGLGLGVIPESFAPEGKMLKQYGYDVADSAKLK